MLLTSGMLHNRNRTRTNKDKGSKTNEQIRKQTGIGTCIQLLDTKALANMEIRVTMTKDDITDTNI